MALYRGFVSGEMLLLVQKMKVLVLFCQTKRFLKSVNGNLCKFYKLLLFDSISVLYFYFCFSPVVS